MLRRPRQEDDGIGRDSLDQAVRLALAAPDEALLRRYFESCTLAASTPPITPAEHRWIRVNLEANPSWQAAWSRLEAEAGRAVDWRYVPVSALAPDRPPARGLRRIPAFARLGLAAAFLLIGLYGALWLTSRATRPSIYALASVSLYEDVIQGPVRGAAPDRQSAFRQGAEALFAAHRSTLGFFPRYDREQVEQAIALLRQAYEEADDDFQRAERAFFLAKAHLMREDVSGARYWLEQVREQEVVDYQEAADDLLRRLDAP